MYGRPASAQRAAPHLGGLATRSRPLQVDLVGAGIKYQPTKGTCRKEKGTVPVGKKKKKKIRPRVSSVQIPHSEKKHNGNSSAKAEMGLSWRWTLVGRCLPNILTNKQQTNSFKQHLFANTSHDGLLPFLDRVQELMLAPLLAPQLPILSCHSKYTLLTQHFTLSGHTTPTRTTARGGDSHPAHPILAAAGPSA